MNDPYLVRHLLKNVKFALLFVALIVFFIGGGVASVLIYGRYNAARELTSGKASLPTDTGLSASQNTISQQLTVNAPLVVNNHFVLTPSALPQTGQAGQLVFDKDTNRLKYYDGTQFVDIAATTSTTTVQGQAGIVTLLAGSGIAVNGSTITNNGIIDILSTPNGIGVSVSGGTATLSLPQALDTSASPTFAGVTVSGAGGGNLTLGTAATLFGNMIQQTSSGQNVTINAGTDNITFTAGGRDFVFPTSGPASQTICTTGVTCVAGGGQAVLLAPGSAQTDTTSDVSIFVNDTGGGNLLQLQNGSADKFIVASNGDTTVGGILHANTITPTSTFTVGSLTQQFALQGSNTSTISARSGANTTTVGFVSPTASATINFPALSAGTYQLCTTSGNCLGAGGGAGRSDRAARGFVPVAAHSRSAARC